MEIDRIEGIARVCHEANRAYCSMIGDNSQVDWHHASQSLRDRVCESVKVCIENSGLEIHFLPYGEQSLDEKRKDYLFSAVVAALTTGGNDD